MDAGSARPSSEEEEASGSGECEGRRLRLRIGKEEGLWLCTRGFVGCEWVVVEEGARGSAKRGIFVVSWCWERG